MGNRPLAVLNAHKTRTTPELIAGPVEFVSDTPRLRRARFAGIVQAFTWPNHLGYVPRIVPHGLGVESSVLHIEQLVIK